MSLLPIWDDNGMTIEGFYRLNYDQGNSLK